MELTTVQNNLFLEEMEDVEVLSDADVWIAVAAVGVALIIIAC